MGYLDYDGFVFRPESNWMASCGGLLDGDTVVVFFSMSCFLGILSTESFGIGFFYPSVPVFLVACNTVISAAHTGGDQHPHLFL